MSLSIIKASKHIAIHPDRVVKTILNQDEFQNEANKMLTVQHSPGFPQLLAVDQSEQSLTMSVAPGNSLECIQDSSLKITLGRKIKIMFSIAAVLSTLEEKHKITHHDLTPDNIFLSSIRNPSATIIDLGAATFTSDNLSIEDRSRGKLNYYSPENFDPALPLNSKSDIFTLGIVFHELVQGNQLFEGWNISSLRRQILEDTPSPLKYGTPTDLSRIIVAMLEKHPNNRPSAKEVAIELQAA